MKLTEQKNQDKYSSHYERRGERMMQKIASAAGGKSWKWIALNLAWTVGPVTYIALQVGHYLGFGGIAPIQNFIYFACYTAIAGVLAVIASILHDAFYKPKVEAETQNVLGVIDRTFDLLHLIRNNMLLELEPNERNIQAACYILEGVGTSPSSIGTAVMDLTDSPPLTRAARNIQVFAEQGMYSRVEMIQADIAEELARVKAELEPVAPYAYSLLVERLQGNSAIMRNGLERSEGFIDRVLRASEENDETLMTLQDALDMVVLLLELLSGREIAVLDARLKGDHKMEDAQETLDEARHHYRMALRKRNGQIRLLAQLLYEQTDMDYLVSASDTTSRLLEIIANGLPKLPKSEWPRYRAMYDKIHQLNKQLDIRYQRLLRTEKSYAKSWQHQGGRLTLAMQSSDIKHIGFYIKERYITLPDKGKLRLAHAIQDVLPDELNGIAPDRLKHMVMDIANELDDLIDMSQPEEQLAIEASNAANFGYITNHLSTQTKAGWAGLAIDAVHENRCKASHRLARNLVHYYRVPLTEPIIELMVEQFGASDDYLRQLNEEAAHIDDLQTSTALTPPMPIKGWNQIIRSKTKEMEQAC